MKKLLLTLFLMFLFSSLVFTLKVNAKDANLIDVLDEMYVKYSKASGSESLNLYKRLFNALDATKPIVDNCYANLIKYGNQIYNSSIDCLKFRVLLGDTQQEWLRNIDKFQEITQAHIYKLKNNSYSKSESDEIGYLNQQLTNELSTMNNIFHFLKDNQ